MTRLARLALWAYPRSFRRDYRREYLRTVADLHTHGNRHRLAVAAQVIGEAATTAVRMRWENMMTTTRIALSIIAAVIAVAALVMGSEAIAVLVVALVALAVLAFAGRDRPITPMDPSFSQRWYLWLAGAATAFLAGLGVVAIAQEDGELSELAWTTWMLSWSTATVLAVIGLGLGATRAPLPPWALNATPITSRQRSPMRRLRWIAAPMAALGLVFLFFGLVWQGAVQLAVAVTLLVIAASTWRITAGTWPGRAPEGT